MTKRLNKLAGACLLAGLAVITINQVANAVTIDPTPTPTPTPTPPPSSPTFLKFDTGLSSLNLKGGPYVMPLANDPTNALGDSISGYGLVNSEVTITLSSSHATTGQACAFLSSDGSQFKCREPGLLDPLPTIDPNQLHGQTFQVDSFFDVYFDISVKDVDTRPGRNFAGLGDGATITLPNNGPAHMESLYSAIFDKNAPNYGIVPPPQVSPYIGHFNIEIPLGGDINGNGQNDKIKFTLAAHSVGDQNRTFTQLPNGTVIDNFDSAAFLAGAVVDISTDPPFTIGTEANGVPLFTGSGAMTGPTTGTSLLNNPTTPEPSTLGFIGMSLGILALRRHHKG